MSQFSTISYLMLEANSSCNLACRMCNRPELERDGLRAPKNLTLEELQAILNQVATCPIDTIKFEGLSEPMLHPQFDVLAAELRRVFPKAFVIIATNLNYKLERTPFLRTLPHVDMVYLSIDGVEQTYERIRVGASYAKLIDSLGAIERNVPADVRRQKLHINFTATEDNFRELGQIYELRDRYGLASVRINLAQNWNEHELNDNDFPREFVEALKRYRSDVKGVGGWDYPDCFWPFNGVIVDVFGDVRQCVINTSMKPIGNLFQTALKDIYDGSPVLREARAKLNAGGCPSWCKTCDYKHLSPVLAEILGPSAAAPRAKVIRT